MLERTIKQAVKERLKALGAYQHWPVQNGMGAPCLDCHGCYQGIYFAIETKAPQKKPTARQWLTINAIKQAGGLVFVIDNLEAINVLLTPNNLTQARYGPGAVHQRFAPTLAGCTGPAA